MVFFGEKQQAAIFPSILTIKLLKKQCRECYACAIFLSSSLTVSIPMLMDALVFADPQWRTVNETDACTYALQYVLDEDGNRYSDFFFKLHETVARHKP